VVLAPEAHGIGVVESDRLLTDEATGRTTGRSRRLGSTRILRLAEALRRSAGGEQVTATVTGAAAGTGTAADLQIQPDDHANGLNALRAYPPIR
jgi:hypothetical protein